MPIRKSTAFTASDGSLCATLEEAQRHEVHLLALKVLNDGACGLNSDDLIEFVFTYREQLLDILTTGPRSRPAARKSKGTTNPRRAAKATPEQARKGFAGVRAAVDREEDNTGDMAAERLRQLPLEKVPA